MKTDPFILYGLRNLTNYSFEDDLPGTDPPTGWTGSGTNADRAVASEGHDTFGIPSTQSARLGVSVDGSGASAVLAQRLSASFAPEYMRSSSAAETEPRFALCAMMRSDDDDAANASKLYVRQFDATGTSAVGSGVELAPAFEGFARYGAGAWQLAIATTALHPDAAWLDLELRFDRDVAGSVTPGVSYSYFDRVLAGFPVDLHKGFNRFRTPADYGYANNIGNGASEVVKIAEPKTEIDITLRNIFDRSADWHALQYWQRWLAGDDPGKLAIWQSRARHTNEDRHFERCVLDPSWKLDYPSGPIRRDYQFKLIAEAEAP
jgi:hypothetical protein